MLFHKLNTFCNNCLNYTAVDPRLSKRNLHLHVFSICKNLEIHPTKMEIINDTVNVSLMNKASLIVYPDEQKLEMVIPKDSINQWDTLVQQLNNQERFNSKETFHDVISQYDKREIRLYSVRLNEKSKEMEISVIDSKHDKDNQVEKITLTEKGIHIEYKYSMNYNLYKAFHMNIYKY